MLFRAQRPAVISSAVKRNGQLQLLGATGLIFLYLQDDLANRLWRVKGQNQRLFTGRFRDPAAPSGPAPGIEGVLNRMVFRFRSHQHGGDGSNVKLPWQRNRWGRI